MDPVPAEERARRAPGTPDRTPVRSALASAHSALAAAGLASPRVDAELLAAHVLGVPRGTLLLSDGFDAETLARYEALLTRRALGTPVQHLTGTAGFRYLDLVVGHGVFVPRPETELLVDAALAALAGVASPVVVDLCAGSGAIGLSVAHERPDATVYLVECDPAALSYLRRNATGRPVRVVAADATDPGLAAELNAGPVRAVLANPPYVPAGTRLPADVAGVDPDRALFGGPDGLSVIRPLIARAAELLTPGGLLAVEHDDTHGTAVPDLLAADGHFTDIADHPDLTDRPRYATATRC
jgi:release factor glutamine methyltransferase